MAGTSCQISTCLASAFFLLRGPICDAIFGSMSVNNCAHTPPIAHQRSFQSKIGLPLRLVQGRGRRAVGQILTQIQIFMLSSLQLSNGFTIRARFYRVVFDWIHVNFVQGSYCSNTFGLEIISTHVDFEHHLKRVCVEGDLVHAR